MPIDLQQETFHHIALLVSSLLKYVDSEAVYSMKMDGWFSSQSGQTDSVLLHYILLGKLHEVRPSPWQCAALVELLSWYSVTHLLTYSSTLRSLSLLQWYLRISGIPEC